MARGIDWERIEREYRAGVLSVREIAAGAGISHTAINKRVAKEGWTRDLTAEVRREVHSRLAVSEVSAEVSEATAREIVDQAASRSVEVVRQHRVVLQRGRRIAEKLLEKAEGILEGRTSAVLVPVLDSKGVKKGEKVTFATLGDRETIADVVAKAAQALAKLIPLERQTFNLDASVDPKDLTDEQIIRLLGGTPPAGGEG
jgi:AcrR family transcriptional regulator